jgi:ferrous iron transport protein A
MPTTTQGSSMSLGSLGAGQKARVESFNAGRGLVNRLAVLGLLPGEEVTMVQNFGHGPVIVSVRDTRVALGRGEAEKITVRRA